jgi:glutaredoxin
MEKLKNSYTIYTKSSCTYCIKVKELLKEKDFLYYEINCDSDLETTEKRDIFLKNIKEELEQKEKDKESAFDFV